MKTILVCLVLVLLSSFALAATVKLSWDPITDPAVAKIYIYQTANQNATKPWPLKTSVAMPATSVSFTQVNSGDYFWYATAASNLKESGPSNEVTANIPLGAPGLQITVVP